MENVVFEATNFTLETGTCYIDLCITNRKKWINSVDVLTLVCSTHAPVLAEISFKTFNQHSFKREIRKYDAADIEGLADQLNITNWDNIVFNSDNINDVYSNFLKMLDDTVNKCIPTKTITVRPNDKLFMNNKIRNKIRQRNRIHYKVKTTNNPDDWKIFGENTNEVIDLVRKAKDEYKNKLTSELLNKDIPPGKWWEIAKCISNFTKARDPPSFLEHDDEIFIYPSDNAEILNTHFSNISNIDNEPDLSYNVTPPPYQLNEFIITEQEVLDQLNILNINKPGGPDGISPRLLKHIAYSIFKPLTTFFNMFLSIKQVPLLWKIAHVSPIF